jgi:hypothetical protein
MSVYFGGSRNLSSSPSAIVRQVVGAVLQSGQAVHVGCCIGADQAVIQAAVQAGQGSSLFVFAAFGPGGVGGCALSSPGAVKVAGLAGGQVRFWAGGGAQVPLVVRLIKRSRAAFSGCSAAVFFEPGPGSLAVAAHAVKAGLPVFAFGGQPQAIPSRAGQWVASQFSGSFCWQFQPSQGLLL